MVNCDFKDNCTSRGYKCGSCNRNQKQDFYVPRPNPWKPYYPWHTPYPRRYTYTSTTKTTADTGDYYTSK